MGTPRVPDEYERARRHLLLTEKNRILDAFRVGAVSDPVRDRLLADVDERWARLEGGTGALAEPVATDTVAELEERAPAAGNGARAS